MIATYLALLLAQSPIETGVYRLSDWIKPGDCSGGACDLAAVFERASKHCDEHPPHTYPSTTNVGCEYRVSAGRWGLKRTIVLDKTDRLIGAGGGMRGSRTAIVATGASPAVWIKGPGGAAEVLDLGLYGTAGSTTAPNYGILVEWTSRIENVYVQGFAQGVRISADVHREGQSGANLWRMTNVWVEQSAHAGVYIQGGDVNAGSWIGGNAHLNCQRALAFASLGECAGVVDKSFLGNAIVAVHTASNKDTQYGTDYPGFLFAGASQNSICLSCYSEGGQAPNVLAQNSIAIQPIGAGFPVGGLQIAGLKISKAKFVNDLDAANVVELWLGGLSAPGTFFEARSNALGYSKPLRLRSNNKPSVMSYQLDWAMTVPTLRWRGASAADPGCLDVMNEANP